MTCEEVGTWLQHHLDHELDERRSGRLAAHLEDCRRCGLEAETYERIKRSLADAQPVVPADAITRLREFGERIARGDGPVE
jgi:anti-sigma factor RsiW